MEFSVDGGGTGALELACSTPFAGCMSSPSQSDLGSLATPAADVRASKPLLLMDIRPVLARFSLRLRAAGIRAKLSQHEFDDGNGRGCPRQACSAGAGSGAGTETPTPQTPPRHPRPTRHQAHTPPPL